MKTIDLNAMKNFGSKVPFVGKEHTDMLEIREVGGEKLHPHVCTQEEAREGDMMVVYCDKETINTRYIQAIESLDLSDSDVVDFLNMNALDTFSSRLNHHLDKTGLWNFAPGQREDVKQARDFLKQILKTQIPYGETYYIPAEEIERFLADESRNFGVAEYYYCVHEKSLLDPVREKVVHIGGTLEEGLDHLVTDPVHRAKHLAETVIERVHTQAVHHLHAQSA